MKITKNPLANQSAAINQIAAAAINEDQEDDDLSGDEEETKDENYDLVEKAKRKKNEIQRAILKFNIKPKAGLKYIYTLGHLKEE